MLECRRLVKQLLCSFCLLFQPAQRSSVCRCRFCVISPPISHVHLRKRFLTSARKASDLLPRRTLSRSKLLNLALVCFDSTPGLAAASMTIDHLMLKVKDWSKAKKYYETAFKPLGYELLVDGGSWGGFTVPGETKGRIYVKQEAAPTRLHFAISAPSEKAVREYYDSALAAGGKDNGAPGPRDHYGPGGVGTFVIDPFDNNIEVVFQQ